VYYPLTLFGLFHSLYLFHYAMSQISNHALELILTIERQDPPTFREALKDFTAEPSGTVPTLIVMWVLLTVLNADNAIRESTGQRNKEVSRTRISPDRVLFSRSKPVLVPYSSAFAQMHMLCTFEDITLRIQ
jgi:hypothetical protein